MPSKYKKPSCHSGLKSLSLSFTLALRYSSVATGSYHKYPYSYSGRQGLVSSYSGKYLRDRSIVNRKRT